MVYQSPNVFLYWAVFSVNLLPINVASLFSWSSPTIPKLYSNDTCVNPLGAPITAAEESLIASLPSVGSIIGSIISGIVAEKIGRKQTLVVFGFPFFAGYLLMANTSNIFLLYIIRLILGVSAGCVFVVLPSYVAEISEDSNRGFLGGIFGVMSTIGHLCAFVIGPLVSIKTFSYFLMAPVTLFLLTFIPFVPESPYYYLSKDDTHRAEIVLKKIRKNPDVSKELLHLRDILNENKYEKGSWKNVISSPAAINGLIVSCGLLIFVQLTGVPFILLYLQPILDASGNIIPSFVASIIIGVVQVVACIFQTLLVDRLGRKILLNLSSAGCSLSLFSLGLYFFLKSKEYNVEPIFWLPLASLISFYISFNSGYGCIPWVMCGELFSSHVKSFCVSVSFFIGLTVSMAITACFPFLREAFGMSGVFFLFSGLGALSIIFVIIFVPETKGKSLLEIQNSLNKSRKY